MSKQISKIKQTFNRWKIKSHIRQIEREISRLESRLGA